MSSFSPEGPYGFSLGNSSGTTDHASGNNLFTLNISPSRSTKKRPTHQRRSSTGNVPTTHHAFSMSSGMVPFSTGLSSSMVNKGAQGNADPLFQQQVIPNPTANSVSSSSTVIDVTALDTPSAPPRAAAPPEPSKRKFGFLQKYRVELPESIRGAATSRGLIPLEGENGEEYKPTPYDIVCGRGRGNYNCEGNILFRSIVSQYVDQYLQSASKAAKTLVLVQILEQVKRESNGRCRFVKQRPEDGKWCELGEVGAREKAGHAMRESIATRKKLNTSKRRAVEPSPPILSSSSSLASAGTNGGDSNAPSLNNSNNTMNSPHPPPPTAALSSQVRASRHLRRSSLDSVMTKLDYYNNTSMAAPPSQQPRQQKQQPPKATGGKRLDQDEAINLARLSLKESALSDEERDEFQALQATLGDIVYDGNVSNTDGTATTLTEEFGAPHSDQQQQLQQQQLQPQQVPSNYHSQYEQYAAMQQQQQQQQQYQPQTASSSSSSHPLPTATTNNPNKVMMMNQPTKIPVKSDQVFGKPVAALPTDGDARFREGDSVLSAVGSSDFLACRSSEFLKRYG